MLDLAGRVAAAVPDTEIVMSNLGPSLGWYARRPVLHLALTPGDMAACRARVPFRHVLLAFRDAAHAWPGWGDVVTRPDDATLNHDWNVRRVRHWVSSDGFQVVWLELGDVATRGVPGAEPPAVAGTPQPASTGAPPRGAAPTATSPGAPPRAPAPGTR
jgi:zona occludens toxin (predicted ATPase)